MDDLQKMLAEYAIKEDNVRQKLPMALLKQKKKFLIALKICDESEFTKEDEEYVKEVIDDMKPEFNLTLHIRSDPILWDDSLVNVPLTSYLERNASFELTRYLDCAKLVFLTYSGGIFSHEAMAYVLRHARQFGDASKNIFPPNDGTSGLNKSEAPTSSTSDPLPSSKFMDQVECLIEDLRNAYDETKFRCLNSNATYVTLFMLRRAVKNEAEYAAALKKIQTHNTYVRLCPSPLDKQLPESNTKLFTNNWLNESLYLAIQAYLNTDDERTKKVLRVTCIQYLEWNGLHLANLFFTVVKLYDIDAGKLWALLSTDKTASSLMRLANVYHEKYQALKDDPTKTQEWFPYCRVLDNKYHNDLAAAENKVLCSMLAYLIDLKIGFDKSTVRLSHWVKLMATCRRDAYLKYAEKIHNELTS